MTSSSPLRTAAKEKMQCGWCGDWLRLEDIEGHLNSEGRTLVPPTPVAPQPRHSARPRGMTLPRRSRSARYSAIENGG